MRIYLLPKDGARRVCVAPYEGVAFVHADGACPKCGTDDFKVAGAGCGASADDRAWESTAYCLACKSHVGTLRVESNTLFGVREDQAVLNGRMRVY